MWSALTESTQHALVARSVRRSWAANSTIFRRGDESSGLHLLESGTIKLAVSNDGGHEQIVRLITRPAPLTVLPLMDGGPYPLTATTLSPSRTHFLAQTDFDALCASHPEFMHAIMIELSTHLRAAIAAVGGIALQPVLGRVATFVLKCAREQNALHNGSPFRLPLNQQQVARVIGATRESTSRAMSQLRRAGIIAQRAATVRVLYPVALTECAEHGEISHRPGASARCG